MSGRDGCGFPRIVRSEELDQIVADLMRHLGIREDDDTESDDD